jgi:hypothetical protein
MKYPALSEAFDTCGGTPRQGTPIYAAGWLRENHTGLYSPIDIIKVTTDKMIQKLATKS